MIKVDKLVIKKFRALQPESEVKLGDCVTLISGLNGTAKSSLLGMISQPIGFSDKERSESEYTSVYNGLDLTSYKTAFGKSFKTEFSNVFRMSKAHDLPGCHDYTIFFSGDGVTDANVLNGGLRVLSEKRTDKKYIPLTFKTGAGRRRQAGRGNFPHPVVYLGLERLRPLATYNDELSVSNNQTMSDDEKRAFSHFYKTVIIDTTKDAVSAQEVDTGSTVKNKYLSVSTTNYDAESASAGQDNLGQIFTALLSFERLQSAIGSNYQGGVLLIDEIDAALHPIAQKMLLEQLIGYAERLKIQIVATTHSLTLLEAACHRFKKNTRLIYLRKAGAQVVVDNSVGYEEIASDLAHIEQKRKIEDKKTTILFEDWVAASFFKVVTNNVFKDFFNIFNSVERNAETCMGNGVLASFAGTITAKKIPEFQKTIVVLDPDSKKLCAKGRKNLFCLPGEGFLEKMTYETMFNLDDDNELWSEIGTTKSKLFASFNDIEGDPALHSFEDRKITYKKWFDDRIGKRSFTKISKLWAKTKDEDCKLFCQKVIEAIRYVNHPLAKHSLPAIEQRLFRSH